MPIDEAVTIDPSAGYATPPATTARRRDDCAGRPSTRIWPSGSTSANAPTSRQRPAPIGGPAAIAVLDGSSVVVVVCIVGVVVVVVGTAAVVVVSTVDDVSVVAPVVVSSAGGPA
jgi:hypothetical protein